MNRGVRVRRLTIVAILFALAGLNVYQAITSLLAISETRVVFQTAPMTDNQAIERFHKIYYENPNTHWTNRWLGISTLQNPNDVWIVQEIISEVKPDFIVEAGTYHGGSAALWAMVLAQVNPAGRVITIDIEDLSESARQLPICRQRVDFLVGSSTDPKIVAEVAQRVAGRKVIVLLDSDHRQPHVSEELRLYAPLVNVGSYLLVQDTNVNGHPVLPDFGPGPMEAVQDFLKQNDQFQVDLSRHRLLFTMHPRGYLKRVK